MGVGSPVAAAIPADSLIGVPPTAPGPTRTTSLKAASPVSPVPRLAAVAEIVPVPPAAGLVAVQPTGAVSETSVVPAGTAVVRVSPCAVPGPLLATTIV